MAATEVDVETLKNFIGGEWVEPSGGHRHRLQPGDRRGARPGAAVDAGGRRPRGPGRRGGVRGLVEHHARRARARPDPAGRRARGARRGARGARDRQRRQAGEAFKNDELPVMADNLRFFAGCARNLEGKAAGEYLEGYTSFVRREAIGPVAQITPWNYPLMMAIWKIGPALAAGNTIVLKPAETTPITTLKLGEIAAEFLPTGVLNVIGGRGETGQALVKHPDIRMVSLTGSVDTGKWIAARGGRHAQARAPRARRQGAGRGVRRRRHGDRARDDRRHRLLQRRPGLHGGDARARRRQGLRRRRRRPRRPGQGLQDGRPLRRGDDARAGQLRAPARARRGLPGAQARATPRSSPAARSPTCPASGSSRPWSAACARTTR